MSKQEAKPLDINVSGTAITIKVNAKGPGQPSSSGKTMVLASTRGNRAIELGDGRTVMLSVNVYEYTTPK